MPKHDSKNNVSAAFTGNYNTVLIARLIGASLVFAVALIFSSLPAFASVLLLIISGLIAGYDVIFDALSYVSDRDFFAVPVIIVAVAVVSYIIGFPIEGAALMILYQIGMLLISYTEERSKKSALSLLQYHDESTVNKVIELVCKDGAGDMAIEQSMRYSAGSVLKLAMVFALVHAVALPLITNYSFTVSIHRSLMIILIATPMSITVSMPITGIMGMCFSACHGIIFNNASAMETVGEAGIAIFDNGGIISDDKPRLVSVQPERIDSVNLLTFAAHALYYSDIPLAKAVGNAYTKDYRLELIEDFKEIPGYGVEADIGGVHVVLANRQLFSGRGVQLPVKPDEMGQSFFMTISDMYVGKLVIDTQLNEEATDLVIGMREAGISRCILLTEDGDFESRKVAEEMDFREVYGECDTAKKLRLVEDIKTSARKPLLFVYAKGTEAHSAADVDIRVSRKGKYADVIVFPEYLANLPFAAQVCRRVREIAVENALFAFIVKAILIFLSIVGYCNIWFAIFIDMAAALATILNSVRVTSESLISRLLYKTGHK